MLSLGVMGCGSDASGPDETGATTNPEPEITAVAPSSVVTGSDGFTLTLTGTGFVTGSVVRWDGQPLTTAVVSNTELAATVPASRITTGAVVQVTVSNPPPGGGVSASIPFTVSNPSPAVTWISPTEWKAGGEPFTLLVKGNHFVRSSVVRWNGQNRATTFVNSAELTAAISASDIANAGPCGVTVFTGGPGGGTSGELTVAVTNPTPSVAALTPGSASVGGAGLTLAVVGDDFVSTSTVRWNGGDRPTSFADRKHLTATIPASDLGELGTARVTVSNPPPGGGESLAAEFVIGLDGMAVVQLAARDILYDPTRGRVYASVSNVDPQRANSIVRIDPYTGTIEETLFLHSRPGKLAISDDGQYLYVSLDSAGAVRRVHLATFTAGLRFDAGSSGPGNVYAQDMEVLPGRPGSLAISRAYGCCNSEDEGVAIFDDGVRRPRTAPGSNVIEFSASVDTLYGFNHRTSAYGLYTMVISDSGATIIAEREDLISGPEADIEFAGRLLYATTGAVVDPASGTRVGTIPARGYVEPDAQNGRVFFVDLLSTTIQAFSTSSFGPLGSFTTPGVRGAQGSLIRWGTDGLAYRANGQVVLVRTDLVTR